MPINNKVLFSISNTIRTFEVLLISVFLSRFFLDKNQLGELLQIIFVSSILVTVVSGLPLSLNYFYGKYDNYQEKKSLFGKFILMIFLAAIFLSVVIYLFKNNISINFKNESFIKYIYVIICYYCVKIINTIFPNYHYLVDKLAKYLFLYSITSVFLFGCFFYNYLKGDFEIKTILFQLVFVEVLRLIINLFIINKSEIKLNFETFNINELVYIGTISIGVILGAVSLYVDKYLIALLLDPTDFVYYQNGAINLPFVNIITSSLFIALIPIFAELHLKNEINELVIKLKETIMKSSFFLIPILVYCFFEAIPLVEFLYGDDFKMSGEVFKIYILRYLLSVMAFSIFMGSIGLEKKSNFIIFLSAIIGLGLNIILIPIYGVKGAAWATVAASFITIGVSLYFISKRLDLDIISFFPFRHYFIVVLISITTYLPFFVLNKNLEMKMVVVVLSVIYYLTSLFFLNLRFKLFDLKKVLVKI
ncbi:polysaccharide biosynthesis C-terminal domain-containing protein [Mangrovimonas sp. DI 80]|uniref:polysaccharide biosynthesis C-terminal domain-containing protein n=1 Tax=Mangrovimonas sp. DI 80 TaxID=1779330 RepID=UPI000978C7EB|nr:polysaccharide biosynthesis C-terminal domain-containing protein [Mangrovimonas sp. DI 80]OMP32204.1 hypothetical protein BKM32_03910 [Mangrovimonas sp. DI 80]